MIEPHERTICPQEGAVALSAAHSPTECPEGGLGQARMMLLGGEGKELEAPTLRGSDARRQSLRLDRPRQIVERGPGASGVMPRDVGERTAEARGSLGDLRGLSELSEIQMGTVELAQKQARRIPIGRPNPASAEPLQSPLRGLPPGPWGGGMERTEQLSLCVRFTRGG